MTRWKSAPNKRLRSRLTLSISLIGAAPAVGVIVGKSTWQSSVSIPIARQSSLAWIDEGSRLRLSLGDKFPPVPYITAGGSKGNASDLFEGEGAVYLFWSLGCHGCLTQARLWNRTMEPALKDSFRSVVFLDEKYTSEVDRYADLLGDMQVVFVDMSRLTEDLNLVTLPTIIAVDGEGRVLHVEYEEDYAFDRELVEAVTEADLAALDK